MVASRRSGLMRTSGTVIMCPSSTGSCTSPCASTSATAWRTASPTRNCRCDGPVTDSRCWPRAMKPRGRSSHAQRRGIFPRRRPNNGLLTNMRRRSERALYDLHAIAFDHVALAHVLEAFERHAAFLPGEDFAGVVLEPLELREPALVDHHVVADQAHVGAAFDGPVGDAATGDLPDFRHREDFQYFGRAEGGLARGRREQAGHRLFHIVHEVVDDVVVADFGARALGRFARFLMGAHVEADDRGAGSFGERHVGFSDAADARVDHARGDLLVAELLKRAHDRLDRTLNVALDDERELLAAGALELTHHLLERTAHAARAAVALLALPVVGDLARAGRGGNRREPVACFRRVIEAEHLARDGGTRLLDHGAGVVDERAHAAPLGAGDDDVATPQRPALHKHGRHGAAPAIELRLDHSAL